MNSATKWAIWADRARGMSDAELDYAMRDCSAAAKAGDAIDRATPGSDVGGRYRDELSVYHAELQRRRNGGR